MSAFKEVLAGKDKLPERHVVLTQNFFAADCRSKPKEDLALGLRRIGDSDIQTARAEAAKYAIEMHDDREGQIESYNDALMRWTIIFGTCDPNDISKPAPFFESSEENVRTALTPQAIRYIWDEIDKFHAETGPTIKAASDEEIRVLAETLLAGPLPEMLSRGQVLRIRKLLGFVLNEIIEATKTDEEVTEAIMKAVMDDE